MKLTSTSYYLLGLLMSRPSVVSGSICFNNDAHVSLLCYLYWVVTGCTFVVSFVGDKLGDVTSS